MYKSMAGIYWDVMLVGYAFIHVLLGRFFMEVYSHLRNLEDMNRISIRI